MVAVVETLEAGGIPHIPCAGADAGGSASHRACPGDAFGVDEPAYPGSTLSLLERLEHQVSVAVSFGRPTGFVVFDVAALAYCVAQNRLDSIGGQKCDWHRSSFL
jgi:hypothetical protein